MAGYACRGEGKCSQPNSYLTTTDTDFWSSVTGSTASSVCETGSTGWMGNRGVRPLVWWPN